MSVTTPDTHEEDALPELPFPTTLVEELARQLDKTARAKQLYPANSPSLQGAVDKLRAAFVALWQKTDLLVLDVSDIQLKWLGRTVWEQAEKGNDSLPWLLYKDGLRQFSIAKGFEVEDLPVFLDILGRIRMATAIDDDLLTLLWEHEWTTLKYRYVELAGEGAAPLEAGATPGEWDATDGEQRAEPGEAAAEAKQEAEQKGGIVRMEDFDSTLYFLDAGEIAFLQNQTKEEYELDLRHQVLNVLLDIFEMQPDPLVRAEIAANLEALTLHLLSATRYSTVAYLLRELPQTLQRARDVPPETHAKLDSLATRLSDPETLAQLIQALDESTALPSAADLSELFGQLRPTALGTILAWVGQTQNGALRGLLEGAASRLAELNTGELVKLIAHEDEFVAVEAVRRSGALKTASAVPALTRALGEGRRLVRAAAVTALIEIGSPGALQALEKLVEDPERDVRVQVLKALAAKAYRPALGRVDALVKGKGIRDADRTERLAIFELYGTLCGEAGVPVLDAMLNPKGGLFGRKEDPELRACAAVALGRVGSASAQQALSRAAGEKDVIVRNAVARAMRGGNA